MKLRTINQTIAYLREQDPDSCLTKTALRRKIVNGEIPFVPAGRKYLLDLDTLPQYLFSAGTEPTGVIRPVPVKE